MKKVLVLLLVVGTSLNVRAQQMQFDADKENQIKSMEAGHWNFSPGFYYWLWHKNYSGAKMNWSFRIKFDKGRSNVGHIAPKRAAQLSFQELKKPQVEKEREKMEEIFIEEEKRSIDRNVDMMYESYRADFNELQQSISEKLTFCLSRSKGKLSQRVRALSDENSILCEGIAYIHRQGLRYELENAKRQRAYEGFKERMEDLEKRANRLALQALKFF